MDMRAAKLRNVKKTTGNEAYSYLTNHQPTKPSMLLLHGFSADKMIWLKYAKFASKNYNLIIPDLLGHGDIPYSEKQSYSSFEQASYVRRLIDVIDLQGPITIVGNSMGGMIAAILAKQDITIAITGELSKPIEIDKLVLINPAGAKTDYALQLNTVTDNPFLHQNMDDTIAFYKKVMHKPPFLPPAVMAYVAQTNYLAKKTQYAHMFCDFFNYDEFLDNAFTPNAKKVILFWGQEDQLLPVTEAEHWVKLLSCESTILADIGHMPMVECPNQAYLLIH